MVLGGESVKSVFSKNRIIDCIPEDTVLMQTGDLYRKAFWSLWGRVESRVAEWWVPKRLTAMLPTTIEGDAGDAGIVDIVTHDDDAGSAGDAASPVEFLEDNEEEGVRH